MFTLPVLNYAYNGLEPYIDEATMKLHHDKHHQTYLDNFNLSIKDNVLLAKYSAEEILQNLQKIPDPIRIKVKNMGGGYINHNLYWEIMAPKKDLEPKGELIVAINQTFGSLKGFQDQFTNLAMTQFGSGWAWLIVDGNKLEITKTLNQDTPISENKFPLLTLDVWEHAYYLKYQNKRLDYIKAWWNVVNWPEVEKRFVQNLNT